MSELMVSFQHPRLRLMLKQLLLPCAAQHRLGKGLSIQHTAVVL